MEQEKFEINSPAEKYIELVLDRAGIDKEVEGVIVARTPGDYRVKISMEHVASSTRGRLKIKGVVENGARLTIDGLVRIVKGAKNSDSFLEMRVLVLDDKSSAVVDPKMEIDENEVKAGHAATVGRIDEEQILYLQSRGVSREEAKDMIVRGFLR